MSEAKIEGPYWTKVGEERVWNGEGNTLVTTFEHGLDHGMLVMVLVRGQSPTITFVPYPDRPLPQFAGRF